ncbi:MAG: hypothetical protein ACM3TT_03935 [Syntrophothermus sp.]
MDDVRCQCKKIVCQIEEEKIVIKCRHCKQYVIIHTKGLKDMEFKAEPETAYAAVGAKRL